MNEFNSTFTKYATRKDKFESLYIFVLYDATHEMLDEKVKKLYSILDNISDMKKRGFIKSRIFDFHSYVTANHHKDTPINTIFFVSDKVEEETLTSYYKDTLSMFDHQNCSYDFGENFPLQWLKDLLTNRDYIHVLTVKANDISHIMLNKTKRKHLYKDTVKSMDLKLIVTEKIPKGENYLIHGSSVVLKNFVDMNAVMVSQKELKDEEILKTVDTLKYAKNSNELSDLLGNINNPKAKVRVVFGKDINKCIKNNLLKTLYCTEVIKDKAYEKIPSDLLIFEIKVVKSTEKGDVGDVLDKTYMGSVGVMMYDVDLETL